MRYWYVQAQHGARQTLVLGPFAEQALADAALPEATRLALELDPKAHLYDLTVVGFGDGHISLRFCPLNSFYGLEL